MLYKLDSHHERSDVVVADSEMGTASSVDLPATLDKETASRLAGDQFDEATFDKAAVGGAVTREVFLAAAASDQVPPPSLFAAAAYQAHDEWQAGRRRRATCAVEAPTEP